MTGAAQNMTAHVMLPRVSWTTSVRMTDRRSQYLTHGPVVNLAVANTKCSRHLTESLSSETSFPTPSVPWQKRLRSLCAPSWLETRTKVPKRPNLITIEVFENEAPPQSAFGAFGLGGREGDRASSFVSSSDEEKESAGRARVLQRCGRARVRELVKMAERMPEEAKNVKCHWEARVHELGCRTKISS